MPDDRSIEVLPPATLDAALSEGGVRVIRIEPSRGWVALRLNELWQYRELVYFLTWRDITVRYKQTVLGAVWAIIQPFLSMVVFSLFFGRLAGVPSEGVPYPIFAYVALVPWAFFASGLSNATAGVVRSAKLIKKVYFPHLVIPVAAVLGGLLDFVLAFLVLLGMGLYFGITPTLHALWLPLFLLLAMVTALGVGLWLSALNVQFRDVQFAVPFLMQIWLFATPIAYPSSLVPEPWRTVYALNPMVGVVEGFRWAMLGTPSAPAAMVAASGVAALAVLVGGALYFRRMERTFADVV